MGCRLLSEGYHHEGLGTTSTHAARVPISPLMFGVEFVGPGQPQFTAHAVARCALDPWY
jgi:hypothetical protein